MPTHAFTEEFIALWKEFCEYIKENPYRQSGNLQEKNTKDFLLFMQWLQEGVL